MARLLDFVFLIIACAILGARFEPFLVLLSIPYFLCGDAVFRGAGLGKRLIRLKVIETKHGGPCGLIQEFVRHRYLFFGNLLFLLLTAHDTAEGHFDQPEVYVVRTTPLTAAEYEALREKPAPEKPAKLDLEGMRKSLEKIRDESDGTSNGA